MQFHKHTLNTLKNTQKAQWNRFELYESHFVIYTSNKAPQLVDVQYLYPDVIVLQNNNSLSFYVIYFKTVRQQILISSVNNPQ